MPEIIYSKEEERQLLLPQGITSPYRPVAIEKHCPCKMCTLTAYLKLTGQI